MPDIAAIDSEIEIPQKELKEKILKRLIAAAKLNQTEFYRIGDEISKTAYSRKKNDSIDEFQLPFKAQLSKASQYIDIIGNMLFQKNPDHRAEPRLWADQAATQRAQMMQDYLNYTASQDDEEAEGRKAVIDAIIYGKGVTRTGWNETKKLVQDVHVPIKDYLWDPDAQSQAEGHWRAVRRRKPKWWFYKMIPSSKDVLRDMPSDARKPSEQKTKSNDFTTDTITFYEMYFDHGLSNYQDGAALLGDGQDGETLTGDDTPMYYIYTESGKLLQESTWQVPLYKRQKWPLAELDLKQIPGEYAGRSPLEPGLPQLEAMNYLYRVSIARLRMAAHAFMIEMVQNGQEVGAENMDRIQNATTEDGIYTVLRVVANGIENPKIQEMIQQLEIPSMLEEFIQGIEFNNQEFQKATGLYDILFSGDTKTQMRSAQEVQFREKTSRNRIDAMVSQVEHWASERAAVRAATARFLATPDDIAPIFGPQIAQQWGFIMPPQADEAQRIAQEAVAQGAPPPVAQKLGAMQAQAQFLQQQQAGGVEYDSWLNEADYTIVSGTCQMLDTDELKSLYDKANNQLVPELLSHPNPMVQSVGLAIQKEMFDVYGAPKQLLLLIDQAIGVVVATPPPPIPPPDAGGAPNGPSGAPKQPAPPGGPQ